MKCLLCKKELTKSQIKEKNKYCSRKCASDSHKKPQKFCLYCSKAIKSTSTYCSKTCSNKQNPRRQLLGKCAQCNKQISSSRIYCSKECYKTSLSLRPRKNSEQLVKPKDSVKFYIQRKKLKMIVYKGSCCELCGYDKCINALQFHHLDPTTKEFNLSGNSYSFDRCIPELDKCILVCANCHAEIHSV